MGYLAHGFIGLFAHITILPTLVGIRVHVQHSMAASGFSLMVVFL